MDKIPDPVHTPRLRHMVLERIRRNLFLVVSGDLLDNVGVSAVLDQAAGHIAAHVFYDVFGRQADEVVEYTEVPETWVDALKERVLRTRLALRWPAAFRRLRPRVRRIATVVRRYRVCPHVKAPYEATRGNLHLDFLAGAAPRPAEMTGGNKLDSG